MIEISMDDIETVVRIPMVFTVYDSKYGLLDQDIFIRQQFYAQMLGWT